MNILTRTLHWLKQEAIEVLPAVVYFIISFNLLYFMISLRLDHELVQYFTPLTVTLGALIVGKVLVIVGCLPIINAFSNKPLIYGILWKFSVYLFFIFICWLLEVSIDFAREYGNVLSVSQHIKANLISPIFWSSFLFLSCVFFIFIVASEFIRVLGKDKVLKILFGPNEG